MGAIRLAPYLQKVELVHKLDYTRAICGSKQIDKHHGKENMVAKTNKVARLGANLI